MSDQQSGHAEQRRYVRLKTIFPVEFRIKNAEGNDFSLDFHQAFTSNISYEGMCLQFKDQSMGDLAARLARGGKIMLFVNLPYEQHPVEAIAEIMWTKSVKKTKPVHLEHFIGIRYLSINKEFQDGILRYAKRLRRRPYLIGAQIGVLMGLVAWLGLNTAHYQEKVVGLMEGIRTLEIEKRTTEKNLQKALKEKEDLEKNLQTFHDRIGQLQTQIQEMEGREVSSKSMAYAAEEDRQKLVGQLEQAQREKEGIANLLSIVKSDKEILETKLAYYKNYQPVPEGMLTKTKAAAPAPATSPAAPPPPKEVPLPEITSLPPQTSGPRVEVIPPAQLAKLESAAHIAADKLVSFLLPPEKVVARDVSPEGVFWGAFIGPGELRSRDIDNFERAVGKKLSQIVIFQDWSSPFPAAQCAQIAQNGSVPHIVWEPWYWGNENKIKLVDIAEGRWDKYITKWGQGLAAFGRPVFIRWGHEFNGNWYPWTVARNGKNPELYVKAYRRVHDLMVQAGATNAIWIWCMNNTCVPNEKWNAVELCYPGDAYVDWIGIDGYNWGKGESWSTWRTFTALFMPRYESIARTWKKPVMVCEFSCAEYGGKKDIWIQDFDQSLRRYFPNIRAVCWFNERKEKNWTVWSSPNALDSVRKVFGSPFYLCSGQTLEEAHKNFAAKQS